MTAVESSPKDIGKRWFEEVWNQRSVKAIEDLLAPNARGHMEGQREVVGKPAFIEFHQAMLKALPDLRIQVRDVLSLSRRCPYRHRRHRRGLRSRAN